MTILERLEIMAVTPDFCSSEASNLVSESAINSKSYLDVSQEEIKQYISGCNKRYANEHTVAQ